MHLEALAAVQPLHPSLLRWAGYILRIVLAVTETAGHKNNVGTERNDNRDPLRWRLYHASEGVLSPSSMLHLASVLQRRLEALDMILRVDSRVRDGDDRLRELAKHSQIPPA